MSKTTVVGILIAVGTITKVVADYLSTGVLDWNTAGTAFFGLLAALGFKLASDQK